MSIRRLLRPTVATRRTSSAADPADRAARRRVVVTVLVTVALLASGAVAVAMLYRDEPEGTAAQPSGPVVNGRGNIVKRLGERAGFGSVAAPDLNTFAITGITVDPPCEPGGAVPPRHHTLVLEVIVQTGPDTDRAAELGRILTPGFFTVIGPDGAEHEAWPGRCTARKRFLPETFRPQRGYSGTIELRVPVVSGSLVLAGHMENAAGWEWELPS